MELYEKPISELLESGCVAYGSMVKIEYPSQDEMERTKQAIKIFNMRNGRVLTELYEKFDILLLTDIFEKFINVSIFQFGRNPLYHIGYQALLGQTDQSIQERN